MQPTHYLVHASNALSGALQPIQTKGQFYYDKKALSVCAATACATLCQLLEDSETIEEMARSRKENEKLVREQGNDFIQQLLRSDMDLMIRSGMDAKMAHFLFSDLMNLEEMLSGEAEHDPERLRNRFEELRHTVCAEAESLDTSLSTVQRVIYTIGGTAVFVTNAMSDSVLGGLATATSSLAGTTLAGKGLKG